MKAEEVLAQYNAGNREFSALDLSEANFSGANLSGANFTGANLTVVNLTGANLSHINFTNAKLNVAKLSGANLNQAKLNGANLNVANLTLADLSQAELIHAALIKAELSRAELSGANLMGANLSNADLKDAKLRQANLSQANLSRADLRRATLTAANLNEANLNSSDLTGADLTGVDLSNAELRQANLSRANLQGANLSGANLRWADLSGAKLSGANLTGADLSNATLLNATLVHVDLTRANLTGVDWAGADLSGSILTGAKLYGVPPFGIKLEGINCRWVDLSPNGDQSKVYHFKTDDCHEFFNETPPTVQIVVEDRLNADANYALAVIYQQIARRCGIALPPPSITLNRRRTTLVFELDYDDQFLLIAYIAILPFEDAEVTQRNILDLAKLVSTYELNADPEKLNRFQLLVTQLSQQVQQVNEAKVLQFMPAALRKISFFKAPTKTVLINSSNQVLTPYHNPMFGKQQIEIASQQPDDLLDNFHQPPTFPLPTAAAITEFVKGFHQIHY